MCSVARDSVKAISLRRRLPLVLLYMSGEARSIHSLYIDLLLFAARRGISQKYPINTLRAATVQIIHGLCCEDQNLPDAAQRLGEILLEAFLLLCDPDRRMLGEYDSAEQLFQIVRLLDDKFLIGREDAQEETATQAWIRRRIKPHRDVDAVLNKYEEIYEDSNVAAMYAIASIVVPAAANDLSLLHEATKHMREERGGHVIITEFGRMLRSCSKQVSARRIVLRPNSRSFQQSSRKASLHRCRKTSSKGKKR